MIISSLTALLKPNRRVRGIAAGDSFRRLVSKTLAKQFQQVLRAAVAPYNFGLCDRSGTDSAVHFLQYLTDENPSKIILSIDGIGAFDHVSRATMFNQLLSNSQLAGLVPYVRQWYAIASQFRWRDDNGTIHHITQAEGGEQGDALMPALFCLALHPAMQRIRALIPQDAIVIAYLDDIYIVCEPTDAGNILRQTRTVLGQ
eukprot:6668348-Karenia_brevis.AAC.1